MIKYHKDIVNVSHMVEESEVKKKIKSYTFLSMNPISGKCLYKVIFEDDTYRYMSPREITEEYPENCKWSENHDKVTIFINDGEVIEDG